LPEGDVEIVFEHGLSFRIQQSYSQKSTYFFKS
jgi:hypothetical protein